MDELEFRRRAYANPNDKSSDFIAALAGSERNHALVEQLQDLDLQLNQALQVTVPVHLAAQILSATPWDADTSTLNKRRLPPRPDQRTPFGWRHLAIAASITFVLGFSTRFIAFNEARPSFDRMGQVAMTHVYAESAFTQGVDEQVTLTAVNAKLQPYGTQLHSLSDIGQVYYANHCLFGKGPAAHLVIQGEHHRVHVFIVPPEHELNDVRRFSDERYHGEIIPMTFNHLVVVSEKDEDLANMAAKIQASLEQSI